MQLSVLDECSADMHAVCAGSSCSSNACYLVICHCTAAMHAILVLDECSAAISLLDDCAATMHAILLLDEGTTAAHNTFVRDDC